MYSPETTSNIQSARSRNVSDLVHLQALKNPHKVALVYDGQADTFAALDDHINRAANALKGQGIQPGDRVAMLSHNNRSFVILRFAIIRAGAIFTPINFMLNASEVAYILENSGAAGIVAEDALTGIVDDAIKQLAVPPALKAFIRFAGTPVAEGWQDASSLIDFDN